MVYNMILWKKQLSFVFTDYACVDSEHKKLKKEWTDKYSFTEDYIWWTKFNLKFARLFIWIIYLSIVELTLTTSWQFFHDASYQYLNTAMTQFVVSLIYLRKVICVNLGRKTPKSSKVVTIPLLNTQGQRQIIERGLM